MKNLQMRSTTLVGFLCLTAMLPLLARQTVSQLPQPGITRPQVNLPSIINSSNVANLRERSKLQLCDRTKTSFQTPYEALTAAGDVVLIASNETDIDYGSRTNQLRAYRTADGTLLWTVKEQYPASDHARQAFYAPVVTDTLLLVPVDALYLRAYDTGTGRLRWTTSPGDIFDLTVTPTKVYYYKRGPSQELDAIDPKNGNLLWKSGMIGPGRGAGPPVILADGIVNSSDDGLRAYDQQMSNIRWTVNPTYPLLPLAPAVVGGTVYHSSPNTLYAVSLADGKITWKYAASGITFNSPVSTGNQGLLYIMCYEATGPGNMLYAFNAATGALVWKVVADGAQKVTSICVCNDVVFVSGWGLYAFNAQTGAKLWQVSPPASTGGFMWVRPAGRTQLIAITGDATLHIYG